MKWPLRTDCPRRRRGRVAEGAPLLREYTGDRIEGSNPSVSAIAALILIIFLRNSQIRPNNCPNMDGGYRRTITANLGQHRDNQLATIAGQDTPIFKAPCETRTIMRARDQMPPRTIKIRNICYDLTTD